MPPCRTTSPSSSTSSSCSPAELQILGISGSLRGGSYNTMLLRFAGGLLEAEGAELSIFDGLKRMPPYDADDDGPDVAGAVTHMRAAIGASDAILFATPEYNSSIPGALKNAIDWLSRPIATNVLRNKPVAVIGASTGMFGAVWAQAELSKVLAATGARVTDRDLPVGHANERFDSGGRLDDPELEQVLAEILGSLVEAAGRVPQPAAAAGSR